MIFPTALRLDRYGHCRLHQGYLVASVGASGQRRQPGRRERASGANG